MARLFAIVKALGRAEGRDQKSFQSVVGNNFFIVTALLLQSAGGFVYLIIGLVMLFPLSTDPLRKIPPSRTFFVESVAACWAATRTSALPIASAESRSLRRMCPSRLEHRSLVRFRPNS